VLLLGLLFIVIQYSYISFFIYFLFIFYFFLSNALSKLHTHTHTHTHVFTYCIFAIVIACYFVRYLGFGPGFEEAVGVLPLKIFHRFHTLFLQRCMECRRGLAMRIVSVRPSVCVSVCPSHAWIVTKR